MTQTATNQQARLAALYDVSAQLGTTLDLGELLNLVMDSIIKLTAAERGILMLVDGFGEQQMVIARSTANEDIPTADLNISRTVVQRAVDTKQPILTDNAQEDDRFSRNQSVIGYQLRSIMCTPLLVRGQVMGAIYVDNRLMTAVFNAQDLELLVMFANQAAMAIDNARLFQQTDQALTKRVEELTLFQRIDRELHTSLDLDHVLNLALDWVLRLTDADGGAVGLLEEGGDGAEPYIRLLVHRSEFANSAANLTIPLTHPVVAEMIETGKTVQTHAVKAEQAIDGTPASVQLVMPILQDGQLMGLIALESHLVTSFLREDVEFVSRLADRAAVAIKNSRLYAQVQAANEARSKFVSLVTHELRLPLTSINGYTDLLLKGLVGPVTDQQKEMLGVVKRNAGRMSVLISDLSDLNRVESGRMKFDYTNFDLGQVVREVTADLAEVCAAKQQTLTADLPETPTAVYADRMRVAQVLANLLNNAHKYTPAGGAITVRVVPHETAAAIDVVDTGIGIKPEDQAHLYEQFFRAEDAAVREQTGWGLGLAVVRLFVEEQGGEVSYQSTYGEGSTFTFTVPRATSD